LITLINGRRRQGKTTLGWFLAHGAPTIVVFDPRRQFKISEVIVSDGNGVYELLDTEPIILIQPVSDVKGAFLRAAGEIREWTIDNPEEEITFLVDEVRFLDTPNEDYDPFEQLLRFSDAGKVNIILTCHRPQDISVDIRAIADHWCLFRTTQEHDLKVVRERAGEEVAQICSGLEPYQFVVWDDGLARYKEMRDSTRWNISLTEVKNGHKSIDSVSG
jgi:hypothetical protein